MAQEIHPIGFRLGIIQVWKSLLQIYGKSFNQYSLLLHKYLQIQRILFRIFLKSNLILNHQEWHISKNFIFLNIYYEHIDKSRIFINKKFIIKLFKIINQLFLSNIFINFYLKLESEPTVNLISIYTQHLLEQNNPPKKILWNLCKLLEKQEKQEKIHFFKFGIFKVKLKGFKIKLSGRLEGSKNQMAKSMEQSVGSLPLTSIKSYIEYKNKEIYTKSGICGIQIWLFYEIN